MRPFDLIQPGSLREAVGLLDRDDPAIRPIAGGTALMLMMKAGFFKPIRLVSLRAIEPRFSGMALEPDGSLRIGAMATLSSVERSALVRKSVPVIGQTLRTLSNVRVRNVATVGGHLAHGDPHMDLPPVLSALGARIVIVGPAGERVIAVETLVAGYLETVLAHDEVIAELIIPPQAGRRTVYVKCTARSADDWPALGIAVSLETDGAAIRDARIVIGAATERPTRLSAAEALLQSGGVDHAALRRVGDAAADGAPVIGDQHGSAPYKKQLVRIHVARAVRAALGKESAG